MVALIGNNTVLYHLIDSHIEESFYTLYLISSLISSKDPYLCINLSQVGFTSFLIDWKLLIISE